MSEFAHRYRTLTRRALALLACVFVLASLCSCVERRIRIHSNVPTHVYLDGELVGETPLDIKFKEYGVRQYTARAEGYATQSDLIEIDSPWYQQPPFDFFAEVLLPINIMDHHDVEITMEPLSEPDAQGLRARADTYRENSLRELETPSLKPKTDER